MRKVSVVVALTLLTVAGTARAQDEAPAAPAGEAAADPTIVPPADAAPVAASAASDSKLQLGLALLGMPLGKLSVSAAGTTQDMDAAFAYGVGLSINYAVIPGLTVGFAPQAIFNVKEKDGSGGADKEFDLMLRVAYAYTIAPKIALYAEVLPGYSIISLADAPSGTSSPKGLVVAGGIGAAMDITDQIFVNLGIGYQMGFQKTTYQGIDVDMKTKFVRIALGGGIKF